MGGTKGEGDPKGWQDGEGGGGKIEERRVPRRKEGGGSEEWGRVSKKLTAMHARIIWNFKVLLGVQVLFGYSL